jgi:hypothetical protein
LEKLPQVFNQQQQNFFTMDQPSGLLKASAKWRNLFKLDACPAVKVAHITCKDFGMLLTLNLSLFRFLFSYLFQIF